MMQLRRFNSNNGGGMSSFRRWLPLLLMTTAFMAAEAWMMTKTTTTTTTTSRRGNNNNIHHRWRMSSNTESTTEEETSAKTYTLDGIEIRGPLSILQNQLLVKVKDTLTSTGGGILLPDQSQERPTEGLVMAVGPGRYHPLSGKTLITNPIDVGMSVLYGKYDGRPIEYNGEECQMIRNDDVLLMYDGVTMRLDNVVPVRDYVLVQIEERPELETSSGVVIAGQVVKDDLPCQGKVVKIGEGRMTANGEDGTTYLCPSPVEIDDVVKFKDYAGNPVLIEGREYSVVKMIDILASYKKL